MNREALAKIIDPGAWDGPSETMHHRDRLRQESLAAADRVIAYLGG